MLPNTPPDSHASAAGQLDQVENALDSLELQPPTRESNVAEFEPSKKRARREQPSPPSSHQDQDYTPRGVHNRRPILRATSPSKTPQRRSPSPVRSLADLKRLEKPVVVNNAEGFETIPPQAQDIVRSIRDISRYDQFIPNGIRDEFTSLFKHPADIKDRFFTTSTVIAADGSKQDLLEDLKTMQRICSKAKESTRLERHEAAWNSAVHQPLLDLAFEDRKELGQGVRARVENIACATVAGDCVPRWSSAVCKKYNASVGAWSVSQETASSTSSTGSTGSTGSMGSIEEEEDPFLMGPQLDSTSHSRVGSRKVDFAVVLEAPPDSALENEIYAVLDLLLETPLLSRSISPSTYRPLVESPIAIAIETKTVTATRDPLLQLGLFAAAIHRRLHTLPVVNATGACPVTKTGVIVTLPLIAVTNHRWEIYFACDRGDKIELVGPLEIGSTETLLRSYMLLACLRLLKQWVQEIFCPAFEQWLSA